jgi:hypothetical protein
MTEAKALKEKDDAYYSRLRVLLDLGLTFTEHGMSQECFTVFRYSRNPVDAVDVSLPFTLLQDLFETQTIASCSHIFSWIEERAPRLTVGMVPTRGKGLVLLRMLNDLLRRLSRSGSTTILCGRIQTFLAVIYPVGERSGVNLKGEYGPTWEGVKDPRKRDESESTGADKGKEDSVAEDKQDESKMQVDDAGKALQVSEAEDKKAGLYSLPHMNPCSSTSTEFYMTFWGLQLPFSKPILFARPETLSEFKEAVNKVLPTLKEANAKEKAMMGSKGNGHGGLKRKREADGTEESGVTEYFFAKLLTSPELLDLEVGYFSSRVIHPSDSAT